MQVSETQPKPKRKLQGAAAMGAGPGRPKGSVNKVTVEFRQTVTALLEANSENVAIWLQQVADGEGTGRPDPGRALELLAKLAEYAAPKLGRVEHVGDGGGSVQHAIKVTFG